MSCLHPVCGFWLVDNSSGLATFKFTRIPYEHRQNYDILSDAQKVIPIPCGKCIGCRLDYSRKWADRMMLELDHSKVALFLTLTVDDKHLHFADTGVATTRIASDVPPFLKRLRARFPEKEIRFYAVSEYGSHTHRPHYHCILYGLSLSDLPDAKFYRYTQNQQPLYVSPLINRLWRRGTVFIGAVSWQSCAYVARYSTKKLANKKDCNALHIEPERSLMSRRPGIGGYYLQEHPEAVEAFKEGVVSLPISDPNGLKHVSSVPVPKYLLNKLDNLAHDAYNSHKVKSVEAARNSVEHQLISTGLEEEEYFRNVEKSLKKRTNMLKRGSIL